jgi:hypothetical protein
MNGDAEGDYEGGQDIKTQAMRERGAHGNGLKRMSSDAARKVRKGFRDLSIGAFECNWR